MKTEWSGGKQKEDGGTQAGTQAFSQRQEGRWCWCGWEQNGPHLRAAVVPPPLSLVFTLRCGNSVRLQRPKLENNLSGWVSKHEQIQEQCFWFLWALRLCFPHVLAVTSLRCRASGPGRYSAPLTAAAASPGFCSEHAAHQPVSSVLRASAEP